MSASWSGMPRVFKLHQFIRGRQHLFLSPSCTKLRRTHRHYSNDVLSGKTVRVGCASGFWGDTAVAVPQLVMGGQLDFLVFDYLSEITMSLLTAVRKKMPEMGYAPDFVQVAMAPFLKNIKQKGVRVISNAGGVNPVSCASALQQVAKKSGIDLKVAVVLGDDLMPQKSELASQGYTDMDTGRAFPETIQSMNAYLGAGAISRALDHGAEVVITGRCVDSAVVLAPLIHTFQWSPENFDLLAAGSLAGHLVECGAQATGGIFTDWHEVPDWDNIGFPIVECSKDGTFILTKPHKTGGLVSPATVSEQLVYEIGDPTNYLLPDVACDFSNVSIKELPGLEGEAVLVTGAKGRPPTDKYKVSATYGDGYRVTGVASVGGPQAAEKGRRTADAIFKRVRRMLKQLKMDDFTKTNIQLLGAEDTYGPHANLNQDVREAVIWMAAHHSDKRALEVLAREIAPAGTGMAPGLTGIVGGRPRVSPVLKLFSFLYPKDKIKVQIQVDGQSVEDYVPAALPVAAHTEAPPSVGTDSKALLTGSHTFRLGQLAYTRSGDKGDTCNIGVIARHPSYVDYLRQALTPEVVDAYFAHKFEDREGPVESRVTRYELPGINGFNFVLHKSLGGGGIASLRSDPQGKAFGQMLLDLKVENVPDLVSLAHQS